MGKTKIGWARLGLEDGYSTNPIRARNKETGQQGYYCEKIRSGCAQCYASGSQIDPLWLARGNATGLEYLKANRDKIEIYWNERAGLEPLKNKKPSGYFPVDMTDWLGWDFGLPYDFSYRVLAMCAIAPWHRYLLLTKRYKYLADLICKCEYNYNVSNEIENLCLASTALEKARGLQALHANGIADIFHGRNIWLGVSVSNQDDLNAAVPHLFDIKCYFASRGIDPVLVASYEPALEHINFDSALNLLDWIIIGGESDQRVKGIKLPGRPFHLNWADRIHDWCQAHDIPMYYKQTGNTVFDRDGRQFHFSNKHAVMPEVNGRRVEEFPEVS